MTDNDRAIRDWMGLRVLVLAPTPTEPLDFGNRKRIFHVCAELKARGASIHYVHYAAESDWRRNPPLQANRVMQASWDALYTVPVTRPLHSAPLGQDHDIDEWWDPAIGDMLTWLFATQAFDVLIVNYAWLSKAFDHAPKGTLKILDTHDRFAGRREMLEANGLAPEFFYTTKEQEAIALNRADVVWAIKAQEEAYFRGLAKGLVTTVPYCETIRALGRTAPPHGILRFGLVGARNNINLTNIRAFLTAAQHYVERTLLPCEFVVAGSCCDDLQDDDLPNFVRLAGRVPDLMQFYRGVDVVLAPMTFSTGLKIKVGEALSLGKAVIAHEHAFEGYEPAHRFHTLPSFDACLWACKEVVARPELIEEMEVASVGSAMASARAVGRSFDRTADRFWVLPPGVCIILDVAELRSGSLILDHACDVGRYLGWQGEVHVVLGGKLNGPLDADAAYRIQQFGEVAALPSLHGSSSAQLAAQFGQSNIRRRSFEDLADERHAALWFAGPPPEAEDLPQRCRLPGFISLDCFALAQPVAAFPDVARLLAARLSMLHVMSREDSAAASAVRCLPRLSHHRVPLLFNGHQAFAIWALERATRDGVALLADSSRDALAEAVRREIMTVGGDLAVVTVLPGAVPTQGDHETDIAGFMRDVWSKRQSPGMIVDLSQSGRHAGTSEVFRRAGLPVLRLFDKLPMTLPSCGARSSKAVGAYASLRLLRGALRDPETESVVAKQRLNNTSMKNDPGWAAIWIAVGKYREQADIVNSSQTSL